MPARPPKWNDVPTAPQIRDRHQAPKTSSANEGIYLDRARISVGVPPHIKIAIADALMEFASMEAAVEVLIWELTGLSFDDGRKLTKLDASVKIELAKDLSEKYGVTAPAVAKGTPTMWGAMRNLLPPRNQIAHGMWVMIDLKIPAAASYRIPSEPDKIAADSFPIERLEAIASQSRRIRECLDHMIDEAHSLRSKRASQSRSHPPNPLQVPKHRGK
jgi:hypothetical protein